MDYDEENALAVKERAVTAYLQECEKEIRQRDKAKAISNLEKGFTRITRVPDDTIQRTLFQRVADLQCHIKLLELFPRRATPFDKQFKVYCQQKMSPLAYACMEGMGRFMRTKVFCEELSIPDIIEFDERDPFSFHGLVMVGDAPYCYARTWINNGQNGTRWAVLDRLCTLKMYQQRMKGAARYMFNRIVYFLNQLSTEQNLGLRVLVVHVPLRPKLPIIEKLLQKGFKFVISAEEYKKSIERKAALVYVENDRIRVNTVHMYFPLGNAQEEEIASDLEEIRRVALAQAQYADDPNSLNRAKEYMNAIRTQKILTPAQQQQLALQKELQQQAATFTQPAVLQQQQQQLYQQQLQQQEQQEPPAAP